VKTARELIRRHAAMGAAVIVSSHQPNLLLTVRTIHLDDGQVADP
jgi:hypothetical protein